MLIHGDGDTFNGRRNIRVPQGLTGNLNAVLRADLEGFALNVKHYL